MSVEIASPYPHVETELAYIYSTFIVQRNLDMEKELQEHDVI
jgi:hypothetical protein